MLAFSVWIAAALFVPSIANFTAPLTCRSVTSFSMGASFFTLLMISFAVCVGITSAPAPLALLNARFSASFSGRRRRFFSHAERYSGVPNGSSGVLFSPLFCWKERETMPAPFAILSRMPLRFSAAAISPARSSVICAVSCSSALISSAVMLSPRASMSCLIAARRASISLILIVLNLHHKFDF